MQKHEQTLTIRQKYAQLLSIGFRFDLIPPDDPFIDSLELVSRHNTLCFKANNHWPIENLRKAVHDGRIRLGLFRKSGKIIGIGYYSEMTDTCTLEKGMFVYGLQLDPSRRALIFAELTSHELAAEFNYSFVRFSSQRKGWGAQARSHWSLKYSVWEHHYGR